MFSIQNIYKTALCICYCCHDSKGMKIFFFQTFLSVSVPHGEENRRSLQLLGQAAGFAAAAPKQQVTRNLHVVVELRAVSLAGYSGATSLTCGQERQLHRDIRVEGGVGQMVEPFISFGDEPKT